MKKTLFILLVIIIEIQCSFAQTITLGFPQGNSYLGGPVYINSGTPAFYSRRISIYTAAEINNAGVTLGVLQKIKWFKTDANGYTHNNGQLRIYIKHTSQSSFTNSTINWSTEVNGATLVYSSNTQNILPAYGWQEFTLTTQFVWNGTDNLEIFVDWHQPTTVHAAINWQYTLAPSTSALAAGTSIPASVSTVTGYRPNVQLEFNSSTLPDAGITAFTSLVPPVPPGTSFPIQVTLQNFGTSALTSATINWSVNGVLQTPYLWSGNLGNAQSASPVSIGSYRFPSGSNSICAWTSHPNGSTDFNPLNDTSCVTFSSCTMLLGNYTINAGAAPSDTNFTSFTDAVHRINNCGISGPVKFTVAPGSGPYPGQVELTRIVGASSVSDSIVFEGNGTTISAVTTNAKPAAILLDGAKRVTFRNLNINIAAGGSSGSYGVQLINSADYCTISNCTISLPSGTSYGILSGTGSTAAGNFTNNSTFSHNTITGGYVGIRLNGAATTPAMGNRVLENHIRDFVMYGIYLQDPSASLIIGNDINRTGYSGIGTFRGITINRGVQSNIISANRIHNSHGTSSSLVSGAYGIELLNSDAPTGSENIIKNNLIYNFNNSGEKRAFYSSNSDGAHYFHNTVSFRSAVPATGNTRAFYQTGQATNVKFINNIVSLSPIGGGIHYALYFNTLASSIESHHNVLFIDPSSTAANNTGYAAGTSYASLQQWQAGPAGYDVGSTAADPVFANAVTGNLRPTSTALRGIGIYLPQVPEDFDGYTRKTTGPDPGAYEFTINTGLKENGLSALPLAAFPNPFSHKLTFQVNAAKAGELQLTLRDALGRTVYSRAEKVQSGQQFIAPAIDAALPAGFYIMQAELNGLRTQVKLIKQ